MAQNLLSTLFGITINDQITALQLIKKYDSLSFLSKNVSVSSTIDHCKYLLKSYASPGIVYSVFLHGGIIILY